MLRKSCGTHRSFSRRLYKCIFYHYRLFSFIDTFLPNSARDRFSPATIYRRVHNRNPLVKCDFLPATKHRIQYARKKFDTRKHIFNVSKYGKKTFTVWHNERGNENSFKRYERVTLQGVIIYYPTKKKKKTKNRNEGVYAIVFRVRAKYFRKVSGKRSKSHAYGTIRRNDIVKVYKTIGFRVNSF